MQIWECRRWTWLAQHYLVVLTPVNIWSAGQASCVQYMCWLDLSIPQTQVRGLVCNRHETWKTPSAQAYSLKVCDDARTVLKPGCGKFKLGTLLLQDLANKAPNPTTLSEDQEDLHGADPSCAGAAVWNLGPNEKCLQQLSTHRLGARDSVRDHLDVPDGRAGKQVEARGQRKLARFARYRMQG